MSKSKESRRRERPRTWAEVKAAVEAAGVRDGDPVWSLDLGPYVGRIVVERDAQGVEIEDDCSDLMERS